MAEPYADLPEHPDVVAARSALEHVRETAEETRLLGLLGVGEHATVLASTEQATARFPLRERLWALHALALTRAGRQADALEALRTVRTVLADELGLDPGPQLRSLEQAILRQAPGLAPAPAPPPADVVRPTAAPPGIAAARAAAPVFGREPERAALAALVSGAREGRLALGQLLGEPGIGKSRLVEDLVQTAREQGVDTAVGRCSQDDGAPPLWPWRSVLTALGLTTVEEDDASADLSPEQVAFRTSERIVDALLARAATGPVLVVLEDLHWADEVSLRVLTHLASVAPEDCGLAVVGTRRAHPEASGQLAVASEALARRRALRLELSGLDAAGAADLLHAVAGRDLSSDLASRWHERSAGNPFFLMELASLGSGEHDEVPVTVREVVAQRLTGLPGRALEALQAAAVVGRQFSLALVAAGLDRAHDDTADDLDIGRAAGLLLEAAAEEYSFVHALTRDAVLASLSAGRAARLHARVAHVLEHDDRVRLLVPPAQLVSDLGRHWLAAGPSHVDRAWPAARAAAVQARSLTAYQEATRLRRAAVEAHRRTVGGSVETRYELLLELATDAAYAADWPQVVESAVEGIALGRELGSPARIAAAASAMTQYCVWLPHEMGQVLEDAVEDLRWALVHVPADDLASRCRLHLALAVELVYAPDAEAETRALVDTGMELARRIDDPGLTWWACRAAWMSSWDPAATEERVALAAEGLAAARAAGDAAAQAVSHITAAIDHLELGHVAEFEEHSEEAASIARRERLPYVLLTWHWLRMSLASMRGDQAEAQTHLAGIAATAPRTAVPMRELQEAAASALCLLWSGPLEQVAEGMAAATEYEPAGAMPAHGLLARAGLVERLRELLASHPPSDELSSAWSVLADWAFECEAAACVGDVALAHEAASRLAPYADRIAMAGAALSLGPVAGYLALAEVVGGDREAAARHADAARGTAQAFGLDAYVDWLDGHRAALDF